MSKGFLTIHIGPHKTGTTYIQKCLVNNREKLLDAGVFYPEIGQEFLYGHHNIVKSIVHKEDSSIDRLIESVPIGIKHVLLSSENFDNVSVDSIEYMASRFYGFNVRVIYYKRDAEPLLFSNWQENIKHGGVSSWSEYIISHLTYPYRSMIINPNLVLDKYAGVFGVESIQIIDYEKIMQQGKDIAVALLKQINADVGIDLPTKDVNKSMRAAATEILRALNQIFANENKLKAFNVRQAFFRTLNDDAIKPIFKELISVVCEYNVPFTLSGSPVLKLLENQFLEKYGKNRISDNNASRSSSGGDFPASGWLCDERGKVLLSRLKQSVEENLS